MRSGERRSLDVGRSREAAGAVNRRPTEVTGLFECEGGVRPGRETVTLQSGRFSTPVCVEEPLLEPDSTRMCTPPIGLANVTDLSLLRATRAFGG